MHLNNVITRVAVGSDDTKWGIRALQLAADFTNSWGAELDVITVVPSNTNLEDADVRHQFEEALDERLAPITAKYPDLKIRKTIVAGNAVETLTRASRDHDMVVVGSCGRGGFTGLLFNSTSQGLLQHSVSPVYVVPRKFVETEASRAAAEPDQDVQTASIDELVKEVPVDRAGEDVEREIESNIDPQAAAYRDRRND